MKSINFEIDSIKWEPTSLMRLWFITAYDAKYNYVTLVRHWKVQYMLFGLNLGSQDAHQNTHATTNIKDFFKQSVKGLTLVQLEMIWSSYIK
jgi:hypothetical protein